MRQRNIERNVHTYTALMNVCIKCGRCPVALETYHHMRTDGCMPNVVTYNTLVDVYGKMGQWELAVKVLSMMKSEVRHRCREQTQLWQAVRLATNGRAAPGAASQQPQ